MTNEELYRQYLSGDAEAFFKCRGSSLLLQKTRRRALAVRTKKRWTSCVPKVLWNFVSVFPSGCMTRIAEN